ncbi:hypothetical protein QVM77_25555, partial [Enterobacter hormaechei]
GIGHDLQRTVQLHVIGDALDVVGTDIALLVVTGLSGLHQAALDDALVEIGDGIAGQRLSANDHLEAVVPGRIVAAGDCHAGAGTQMEGGVVH